MPTFLDESGDTGPPKRGGTSYFRLAAVWVPTQEAAQLFRERIQELRRRLSLPRSFEFKFAKTHQKPEWREAFFSAALSQDFRFAVSSIDKTEDCWASADRGQQHWACATEIAAMLRATYHRAEEGKETPLKELVVVDDNTDKDFLAIVKKQFRGMKSKISPESSMIGRVIFRGSDPDEMIQLVDLVCGASGALTDGSDRRWYDMIAERHLQ